MAKMILALALLLAAHPDQGGRKANDAAGGEAGRKVPQTKKKPSIKAVLGKERVNGIEKAGQINVYRIKEFVADAAERREPGKKYFSDYEVLGYGKVSKRKSKALKKALLDARNYSDPEFVNKCTFTGTLGVELISKRETVNIIISYPCKKMLFIRNGEEFYRDLVSVEPLNQIAHEFLKDLPGAGQPRGAPAGSESGEGAEQ